MTAIAYRDGRIMPCVKLWTWRSDHRGKWLLAIWALGWSVTVMR